MEINTYNTEGFIDLHVHTDYSSTDREYMRMNLSPKQLLKETKEFSDKFDCPIVIAVTDHDNILGCKEIRDTIKENPEQYKKVKFISGAEFTVCCDSLGTYKNNAKKTKSIFHSLHLLGYNFDLDDKTLNYYAKLKSMEYTNTFEYEDNMYPYGNIVLTGKRFLNKRGYKLPLSAFTNFELSKSSIRNTKAFLRNVNAFVDFCKYSLKVEDVDLIKMYNFILGLPEDFIKHEKLGYYSINYTNVLQNAKLDVEEMMSIIQDAGGVSVLAHPNLIRYNERYIEYRKSNKIDDEFLPILKKIDDEFLPILKKFDKKFNMANFSKYTEEEMEKKRDILEYVVAKLTNFARDPISGKQLSGLMGIELLHSANIYKNFFPVLTDIAERYNLYVTGGSDKHGSLHGNVYKEILSIGQIMPLTIEGIFPKLDDTKSMFSIFSCKFVEDILNNEVLRRKPGNANIEISAKTPTKAEIFDYNNTKRFIERYANHDFHQTLYRLDKQKNKLNSKNIKIVNPNYDIKDLNSKLEYYSLEDEEKETSNNKDDKDQNLYNKKLELQQIF